jgi:insertion element IS1 protein InsB
VWKARDRASGRLVDWEPGGRDRATLERLVGRLKRWNARLYRTDDWAAYADLIPVGRLHVGKDQTHGIERDHARQRHRLARFRRRSIGVSRAVRMVDASIALFAAFGGNDKIQDLLSMLT